MYLVVAVVVSQLPPDKGVVEEGGEGVKTTVGGLLDLQQDPLPGDLERRKKNHGFF